MLGEVLMDLTHGNHGSCLFCVRTAH
jgi:hypothetical protein